MLSIVLHVAYFGIALVCWMGLYIAGRIYGRQNPSFSGPFEDAFLLMPTLILALIWPALPLFAFVYFMNSIFEQVLNKSFPKK